MELTGLKIDKNIKNGFRDEHEVLPRVHKSIDLGFNIGFRGPTGCGKTYLVQELAKQYGKKLWILNMTVDTAIEEIKGRLVPEADEEKKGLLFKWINGVLVEAMLNGDWLVIEEANFMNEEIASVFYSVMDHRKSVQLDEHKNELIKAHKDFRLFLTMNWGYKGTVEPNDAIKNRIDAWFDLVYLAPDLEAELLVERTKVDKDVAAKIVDVANQFRSRDPSENLPDISTRILLRWASMVREGLRPEVAAEHNIIPLLKYEELEKQKIREIVNTAFEQPETIIEITKTKIDEAVLKDGCKGKAGDIIEFIMSDGKRVNGRIASIIKTSKTDKNPLGIKLILEDGGWVAPGDVRLAK